MTSTKRVLGEDRPLVLPFSAPGALKGLEFGYYGVTAGAGLIFGLAAARLAVPVAAAAAVPAAAAIGLAALGYRLGRRQPAAPVE